MRANLQFYRCRQWGPGRLGDLMKAEQESSQQKPAYNQGSDCGPKPGCPATRPALNLKKHNSAAEPFSYLGQGHSCINFCQPLNQGQGGRRGRREDEMMKFKRADFRFCLPNQFRRLQIWIISNMWTMEVTKLLQENRCESLPSITVNGLAGWTVGRIKPWVISYESATNCKSLWEIS